MDDDDDDNYDHHHLFNFMFIHEQHGIIGKCHYDFKIK